MHGSGKLAYPSEAISVFFRRGVLRHVKHVRPNRGPTKRGRLQDTERRTAARHFLACLFYGVVRHSFGAARQSLAYKYYKTSEVRKPYLKSGNSSKTAAKLRTVVTLNSLQVIVR